MEKINLENVNAMKSDRLLKCIFACHSNYKRSLLLDMLLNRANDFLNRDRQEKINHLKRLGLFK